MDGEGPCKVLGLWRVSADWRERQRHRVAIRAWRHACNMMIGTGLRRNTVV